MRANRGAVLYGAGDLRVEDLDMPQLAPRQVMVEIRTVGLCASDIHYYTSGGIGPFVVRRPLVLGHEPFGVVVERGSEALRHRVGTRVAIEPQQPCGRCAECASGCYNLCPGVSFFATPPQDPAVPPAPGALARYVPVDENFAHPVPDCLSDEAGALIEPLAVALYAADRIRVARGDTVLITGAGPIGLLALQVARARGAGNVWVTDIREMALGHARRLGATMTANPARVQLEDLPVEPTAFIECSGAPAAMAAGLRLLARRGRAVLVGIGPEDAELPVAAIRRKELTVTATFRYRSVFPEAIALAANGQVDLASLITDRCPLEQAADAFAMADGPHAGATIKTVIDLRQQPS
jgi:L-iditol 2-dehydrogenase